MRHELDCRQVARLISDGLDAQLEEPQRARLRLHFAACEACRKIDQQMAFLRLAVRQMGGRQPGE